MTDRFLPLEQPPVIDDQPLSEWLSRMMILINGAFNNTYRMNWRGDWTQDTYYAYHDVIRLGEWTMICTNPNGTTEYPIPVPTGDPFWVSGEGDTPAWGTTQSTTVQIQSGQRYTWEQTGFANQIRIWVDDISPDIKYGVWAIDDPLGEANGSSLSPSQSYDTLGWNTINVSPTIIEEGSQFELYAIKTNEAEQASETFVYDYTTPNNVGVPAAGEILHANRGIDFLRISDTDKNGVDRSSVLGFMNVGDKISGAGIEWTIQGLNPPQGTYYEFDVVPAIQGTAGTDLDFKFTTFQATPLDYVLITDKFVSNDNILGVFGTQGVNTIATDENMYGIDMQVQGSYLPNDWEIVSYSGV